MPQRRLSELMADQAVPQAVSAALGTDADLLLPRLVARITELEEKLYGYTASEASEAESNLLDRFVGFLKRAAGTVDAGVAYIVGEDEAQTARTSQLTREATSKALLITVNKLQQVKGHKAELETRVAALTAQLQAAQALAASAGEAQSEAASAMAQAAAARSGQLEQQLTASQEQLRLVSQQLAEAEGQLDRLQNELASSRQEAGQLRSAVESGRAEAGQLQQSLESSRSEAAQLAAQLESSQAEAGQMSARLASSSEEAGQLQQALQGSRGEAARLAAQLAALVTQESELRGQMAVLAEQAGSMSAEAEALKAAKAAVVQELNETKARLERACATADDFQRRFLRERADRRRLHEQLSELRGNIRVMVRVRPLLSVPGVAASTGISAYAGSNAGSQAQQQQAQEGAVSCPHPGTIVLHATAKRQHEFEFDAVFGSASAQEEVFEEVCPLIRSAADGYNVCIFAYGQTGSGKTHTMMGPPEAPGLSVRALQALFQITAAEAEEGQRRSIQVAMMEVYNEAVRDLLASKTAAAAATANLQVSAMGPGQLQPGTDRVPGLTWRPVSSVAQVLAVLGEGTASRATASTSLNAHSSRSHALLSVRLVDETGQVPTSTLHLIDLAGSERVARSEVKGEQLREAQAINKSLSALGDVVAALQAKSAHVPYRNSRLTQVLQDSLCGSSKVLLMCCVSPEPDSAPETLSSLTFAQRAAQVEMGPIRRVGEAAGSGLKQRIGSTGGAVGSPLQATAGSPAAALQHSKAGTPQSASRLQRGALKDASNHA